MKRKITYGLLTAGTFLLFAYGIPLDIYEYYSTFFTLVGSIAVTVFMIIFVFCFIKEPELKEGEEDKGSNSGYVIFGVLIITLFGSGIFFIQNEISREKQEIITYGEFTKAWVIDGSSFKTRKADFTKLTVSYVNNRGKNTQASCDISAREFDQFYKNMEVEIIYSTRYPSIVKLLRSARDKEYYLQEKARLNKAD